MTARSRCGTWKRARKSSPCAGTSGAGYQPGLVAPTASGCIRAVVTHHQGVGPGNGRGNPHPARATAGVGSLALSARRQAAVLGQLGPDIKVWDLETGKEILTLRGHTTAVTSLALSPDGKRLYSGSSDDTIKVWDLETGKETHSPCAGTPARSRSLAWRQTANGCFRAA